VCVEAWVLWLLRSPKWEKERIGDEVTKGIEHNGKDNPVRGLALAPSEATAADQIRFSKSTTSQCFAENR